MKALKITDVMLLTLVALLVASMMAPAFARLSRTSAEAKCQSNMRKWTQAMGLYVAENFETYPTNRVFWGNGTGSMSYRIHLTPDDQQQAGGALMRFQYGINWVEALYPYLQASAAKTGQDWKSFRRCPNSRDMGEAPGGSLVVTSYMTYAFNYNLVECHNPLIRGRGSVMMLREMDRRVNSILRPANYAPDGSSPPDSAFLTTSDNYVTPSTTDPNRHGAGSYIAFADGHVRYFTSDYYPARCTWDADTRKWYNFVYPNPASDTEVRLNKSIAVTP